MLKKLETATEIKDRTAVLHALHKNKEELKTRIKYAKKKNDVKFSDLRETLNAYPAVSTFILYNWISRKLIYALGRKHRNHNQEQRK